MRLEVRGRRRRAVRGRARERAHRGAPRPHPRGAVRGHRGAADARGGLRDPLSDGTALGHGAVRGVRPLPGAAPVAAAAGPALRCRSPRRVHRCGRAGLQPPAGTGVAPRRGADRPLRQPLGMGVAALPAQQDRAGGGSHAGAVSVRAADLRGALHPGPVRGTSACRRDRDAHRPGRGAGRDWAWTPACRPSHSSPAAG